MHATQISRTEYLLRSQLAAMPSAAADVSSVAAAHQQGQITNGYTLTLLEVKSGLLAHAVVHATFTVPPAAVFSVLNAPRECA